MNQITPKIKAKLTNTQSIRFPIELYEQVADKALEENTTMNSAIINLVLLGLGYQNDFNKAVKAFVFRNVSPQEMKDLMNGLVVTR